MLHAAMPLHTCMVATNIMQLGRGIVAHCNMSLFFSLAARLMQCTRPQAADWLARRRRIDQDGDGEAKANTATAKMDSIRITQQLSNQPRVPAAVGPAKIILCK